MSRHGGYVASEIREREPDYRPRPRRGEERFYEEDVEYTRRLPSRDPPRERKRETIVREREEFKERPRSPPDFLREDYGRTSAGPMVLRAREREDFEFVPRPRPRSPSPEPPRVQSEEIIIRGKERRRSPSPPPVRDREEVIIRRGDREPRYPPRDDFEREEVVIRRDREERRPPPREEIEREEVIIRRDRADTESRAPPRREEFDREQIIIRDDRTSRGGRYREEIDREEISFRNAGGSRRGGTEIDFERDEVVSRGGRSRFEPPPREHDMEQIVISRNRDRESRYDAPSRNDELALTRAVSHERARSQSRGRGETDQIIIRRNERDGPRGGREREEIVIRRDRSRSSSPESVAPSMAPSRAPTIMERPPPPEIRAPDIHQNVITHHRHVYHEDFEFVRPERPRERTPQPPSPPPPPPPPVREDETIEIHRRGERNGRAYDEDIIIRRDEVPEAPLPPRRELPPPEVYRPPPAPVYEPPPPRRAAPPRDERDIREEAEFYNQRALERAYPGEGYHGATKDWAIVDVPPGTNRVRMDGAGGGAQEITWQRYNGIRRSKFMPDGASSDEGYGSEVGRPAAPMGEGPRYRGVKDAKEGLWTEITKDLVVKEALEEAGLEFEETDDFYYVIAYLRYEDISRLVGLSEDIRHARRRRIKELDWERRALPPPEEVREVRREREVLMIEEPPRRPEPRPWDREDEIYREREVVVRGGPPPRRY